MSYEITVKKITEREVVRRGEWRVIDKRPWTDDELQQERISSYYHNEQGVLSRAPLKEVLGYCPDVCVTETVETELLKQTVDDLDLAAVVKAINKL